MIYAKVNYLNSGPLKDSIFKFGIEGAEES